MNFKVATSLEEMIQAFMVRGIVFLEEQGVPYTMEHDADEYTALHILGEQQGEPYAAGRIRFFGEYAKLERIAIRKSHRGKNLGHELTNFMISIAEAKGFKKIKIHAEAYLKKFYEQHGFEVVGEKFREVNIDHYVMIRKPPKEQ